MVYLYRAFSSGYSGGQSHNSIFSFPTMRATSLCLLYAAIWPTSTTLALVAHRSSPKVRADTTFGYPHGYDAKNCPLDRTSITLHASPPTSQAVTLPDPALRAPPSSKTQRELTPQSLSQLCRQVARFAFTGSDYHTPPPFSGSVLTITSSTVQPGLYVASMTANKLIRSLEIDDMPYNEWQHGNVASVVNDQANQIGVRVQILAPTGLKITIRFWWPDTVGEFSLFKIGPSGYNGPSP